MRKENKAWVEKEEKLYGMSKYFDDLSNFDGTILNPKDVFNWIFTIENFIIDNVLEEKHVK